MFKAILFDLDGTLLHIPHDVLIKQLFAGYAKLGKDYPPAIMAGYQAMLDDKSDRTNDRVFFDTFTKLIPSDKKDLEKIFNDFYNSPDFENIKNFIAAKFELAPIFKKLKDKGLKLAIATSPTFPITAIEKRLNWIGLTADNFDFVTSYDKMTCCKNNPNFYTQVLKNLGVQPNQALMVGNNVAEDILPAQSIGCQTILLTDNLLNPNNIDISNFSAFTARHFFENLFEILALPSPATPEK